MITYEQIQPGNALTSDRRLYLTADGLPCEEGDPRRASLLVAAGLKLPAATAQRLGITAGEDGRLVLPGAAPAAEAPKTGEEETERHCQAKTTRGTPCKHHAADGSDFCATHQPK